MIQFLCLIQSKQNQKVEKEIAFTIKKQFDKEFDDQWHVIVGKNFGLYVSHLSGRFLYGYVNKTAIACFAAGKY